MAALEDDQFVLVSDDLCILYSDGATETFALPHVHSKATSVVLLRTKKKILVVGYESGEILVHGLDASLPSSFHFHASPVLQIVARENSVWCLHKSSVVVRIYDIDLLLTSDSLSYGCIKKYQLVGDVKNFDIINGAEIVAVGATPMIQHVKDLGRWDGDVIADELDSMKIRTKQTASKVASSITGWWSSRNSSTDSLQDTPKPKSTLLNKRLVKVIPEVTMDEPERTIHVAVSSPDGKDVMVADAFNGRVFLFRVAAGLFTRLWKGYRGAQFQFLDERSAVVLAPRQPFLELRDVAEDRRLAVLQLSEEDTRGERKDFGLLSKDILACFAPTGIEFHRLVYH